MTETANKQEVIQFQPSGVCCKLMQIQVCDGVVQESLFHGGCNGNLQGVSALIKGMTIDEVIERLSGICCGPKDTSCPDQLAKCLIAYKNEKAKAL